MRAASRIPAVVAMAALSAIGAACYAPTYTDPRCGPNGACPEGWSCAGGEGDRCVIGADGAVGDGAVDGPGPGPQDAAVDAVVSDGPCEPTWQNILRNGDFESGDVEWMEGPGDEYAICRWNEMPLAPHGGSMYASCFGWEDFRQQFLTQALTLPPETSRVRLVGYRCLVTVKAPGSAAYDTLKIKVTDDQDDTATVADVASWSNRDAFMACDWTWFEAIADVVAPEAAARPVVLRIESKLDGAMVTSFYLDTLAFEAFGCAR